MALAHLGVQTGFTARKKLTITTPTNDLVTAPEIMFFWVARMIIAGYEYRSEKPFKNVYYTGIVRDKQGRKMSKSLGNSPDPIELMKQYGADGVRVGMLFSSPAGNDLLFEESLCEQGRNFSNKIWNALRLIKSWEPEEKQAPESAVLAGNWMDHRLNQVIAEVEDYYGKFRISDVLMSCYKFAWNDFCSWYLEAVKPNYGEQIDVVTYNRLVTHFEAVLELLHPLMPFITEEIWHELSHRAEPKDSLVVAPWPKSKTFDEAYIAGFQKATDIITQVRNVRKQNNIPNKTRLDLFIRNDEEKDSTFYPIIKKLAFVDSCERNVEMPGEAFTFVLSGAEYAIPFSEDVDVEGQIAKLKDELSYTEGFLKSVEKKLSNERFVNNAPEQVVATEKKKQQDAESKISLIREKLEGMGVKL